MSKGLGKGLGALLNTNLVNEEDYVSEIPLSQIRPNPYQPRKEFAPEAIEELAQSIQEHGIVQPLIVRKSIKGYDLVAGERRLRAAQKLGLDKVPVVVKNYTDQQLMEIALIENLQRENLNALEEAEAYQKLMNQCSYTQEEVAKKVGKSRSHVANLLRLLQLPETIRKMVSAGSISMGHARALLSVPNETVQIKMARDAVKKEASVRELEEWVKRIHVSRETSKKKAGPKKEKTIVLAEERLRSRLGTSVQIKKGARKGKIEIEFYSQEDLQRLLELLEA
jgi:ParB family chromosome partitioning protein